jgi:hypothetical protein
MLGLYILGFFIAIIIVVYWTKANDTVPLGGRTKGLLRMKFEEPRNGDKRADASRGTQAPRPGNAPESNSANNGE